MTNSKTVRLSKTSRVLEMWDNTDPELLERGLVQYGQRDEDDPESPVALYPLYIDEQTYREMGLPQKLTVTLDTEDPLNTVLENMYCENDWCGVELYKTRHNGVLASFNCPGCGRMGRKKGDQDADV